MVFMAHDPYLEYLTRFQAQIGAGAFGKFKGRLVRKLNPDEFSSAQEEFSTLRKHYEKCVERGDTINDAVTKLLAEKAAELLLED
jgi:hypothetical protein